MSAHQADALAGPDAAAFRTAMGLFPTGVAIITSGSGDDLEAVTANSLTSVSMDPMLLLVCIRSDGRIRSTIDRAGAFTVSILSATQEALSTCFATRTRPSGAAAMERLGGQDLLADSALFADSLVSLECTLDTQHVGGDHTLFLGRVTAIHLTDPKRRPLVTHRGAVVSVISPTRPEQYLG